MFGIGYWVSAIWRSASGKLADHFILITQLPNCRVNQLPNRPVTQLPNHQVPHPLSRIPEKYKIFEAKMQLVFWRSVHGRDHRRCLPWIVMTTV